MVNGMDTHQDKIKLNAQHSPSHCGFTEYPQHKATALNQINQRMRKTLNIQIKG